MTKQSIERKFQTIFKQHFDADILIPELTKIVNEYFQLDNQNEETK